MKGILSSLTAVSRTQVSRTARADGDTNDLVGVALLAEHLRAVVKTSAQVAVSAPMDTQEIVGAVQRVLDEIAAGRSQRRDTQPSADSLANYERKRRQVEEAMEDESGNSFARLQTILGRLGRNANTFKFFRCALKQGAIADLESTIDALALTRSDTLGIRSRLTEDLRRGLGWFASILALKHQNCLTAAGTTKLQPKSKSQMLKFLPQDWREQVSLEASRSETYGLPCALLDICGLRPVELGKGVEIKVTGDRLCLRILGGKVREHAGQPWRELEVRLDALPAWVRARVPRVGTLIVSADPDNMRGWFADLSERLFPRHQPPRKSDVLISAYVYRHAIVTDMRDQGWSAEEIAAVIGESSAPTVAWYGLKNVGGRAGKAKKPRAIAVDRAAVQTAREVKPRIDHGLPEKSRSASNKAR